MGKKYNSIVAVLAIIGAIVAGVLTYVHYYPGLDTKFVFCRGYAGNCTALAQWDYADIFGIPLAGYGLYMFLLILFTSLVADYAGGKYLLYSYFLSAIVVGVSLLADVFLAIIMFSLKVVCLLCVMTYVINLLLLLTLYFWYRYLKQKDTSLQEAFRMSNSADSCEKRAVAALYALFVILLAFSVFSTAHILQIKTSASKQSQVQTKQAVDAFYQRVPEVLVLPDSSLKIGNDQAGVQIVAFTDFLCSACFQLFQIEKDLRIKYGDALGVTYYNYPLDKSCNGHVEQSVYKSSCTASKAMLAAAGMNVFPEYVTKHFARYQEFRAQYSAEKAFSVAAGLIDTVPFGDELASEAVDEILKRDIELAKKLQISATPTLFINGRRMEGLPPQPVLEGIIERELQIQK